MDLVLWAAVGFLAGVALHERQRVGRLEVAVSALRRQLELALPPPPPGDGPFRSARRPPATSVPGDGVVRSEYVGVHENGIPLPLGPKWGLG